MAKIISSLSGFPEWLPQQQLIENFILEKLRQEFELHGFVPLQLRAVEPVKHLLKKGETSKEIYLLSRLQDDRAPEQKNPSKQLGLHFDLTVPFARFVSENAGLLQFPFKRYQIQKVWRGERPQDGRFREFIQADIDVICEGELPFHHEATLPLVMADALLAIGLKDFKIHVNNRKLVQGYFESLGVEKVEDALRVLDKADKLPGDKLLEEFASAQVTEEQAINILKLAQIKGTWDEIQEPLAGIKNENSQFLQGLNELERLLEMAESIHPGTVLADLKIARGLDYYTGSVFETFLDGHEELGSICSGGRYDNLVTVGKKTYPGVGMSIGVSRLLSRIIQNDLLTTTRPTPTVVMVALENEEQRPHSEKIARTLRTRGIAAETAEKATKYGKQIKAADRRGIPFVWFPGKTDEVKDIRTGKQEPTDPQSWNPPREDLTVQVKNSGL